MDELEPDGKRAIRQGTKDISLQAALERLNAGRDFQKHERRELDYAINSVIEQDYAADSNDLSFHHWEQDDGLEGEDVLFPGGYGQLIQRMADRLTVKLDHQVHRIQTARNKIEVETSRLRYSADCAVVTLPLGVLQRGNVVFDPPLPDSKKLSIARVGVGLLNKAYLRFPRRFWRAKADGIGLVSELKGRWSEFLNVARFIERPILLGFNAAAYARRLEPMSDPQTTDDTMAALRSMFGRNVLDPTDIKIRAGHRTHLAWVVFLHENRRIARRL